jgi:hypothetical protein
MLVLLGCWYMAFSCYLICWEKLAVIRWALGRGGVDGEGGLSGLEVEVGGEMTGRQQLKVDACFVPNAVVTVALAPSMGCSLPLLVRKVKWTVLAPGRPGST